MQSPGERGWRCLAKVPTKDKASRESSPTGRQGHPRRGAGQIRQDGQEDECPCAGKDGRHLTWRGEGSTPKVVTQTCEDITVCSDPQSPRGARLWGHALGGCWPRGCMATSQHFPQIAPTHSELRGGGLPGVGVGGMQILPPPSPAANSEAPGQLLRRQHPSWPAAMLP